MRTGRIAALLGRGRSLGRRGADGHGLAELEAQAAAALVATDDAVLISDQELGFATARFGHRATTQFSAALAAARAELAEAFRLRQQLDQEIRAEPGRRAALTTICARCAEANRMLNEQSGAFDRLQDLERRAPQFLPEVEHHITQQDARAAGSRQVLGTLTAKYSADAVSVVSGSPDQAGERLTAARTAAAAARQALATDSASEAAVFLQAAESAADQAESLLDAIEHLEAELTQAASALPAALREIDVEIAEATTPRAGPQPAVVSRAQRAAAVVRTRLADRQPFDSLAALRKVVEADAALDQALAGARAERDRLDRARALLDQIMLVARSSITTASDYLGSRRGGIGAQARTRLSEAHRHFRLAIGYARDNPEAAVAAARQADTLGQQARSLAEQDVAQWDRAGQGLPVPAGARHGFGGRF